MIIKDNELEYPGLIVLYRWCCNCGQRKLMRGDEAIPIGSMYAIYGNIYHPYTPNVSIYTIHGSYGIQKYHKYHKYPWTYVSNIKKNIPNNTVTHCYFDIVLEDPRSTHVTSCSFSYFLLLCLCHRQPQGKKLPAPSMAKMLHHWQHGFGGSRFP